MRAALLLAVLPAVAAAQATTAAKTITEADVRRRVFLIADDSMGGRDTPSKGLDLTAAYVASEFKRFGLKPAGDAGGYFQRYGIRLRELDAGRSSVTFSGPEGAKIELGFGSDLKPVFGAPRNPSTDTPIALLGGPISLESKFDVAALQGHALIWIAPPKERPNFVAVVSLATSIHAPFVMSVIAEDSTFARLPAPGGEIVMADSVGWPAVIAVKESSITRQFPDAGDRFAALRGAAEAIAEPVPGWTAAARITYSRDERRDVPNVIGIVPGTDPTLRQEYVIVTAHMDHVGSRCRGADGPDKICNGADDNASGTTGVLELAQAFAHRAAAPKRSMIFVTVSGEERGLWGSQYVAEHPPVPIGQIVANINMDHLGRNWRDSIVVIGTEHSSLGAVVTRVRQAHPELNVSPLPDKWPGEQIYFRSDHYNFARVGVPILFFTNGFHADYHAVTDSPDKIDAEKESRVLQYMFYTILEIANAPERPVWNPESYRMIVRH
jgi:hypothetical protein